MKLHWSPRSPFVRKVMIFAHETGLAEAFERARSVVAMSKPNAALMLDNPLSKLPTLVLDDGRALFDSVVICEYLDSLHTGAPLFPKPGQPRWEALRWHALGDGLLDVLILWRNERERDSDQRLQDLMEAFELKTRAALALLDREAQALEVAAFGIGPIAIVCALGYLDFRFPGFNWRSGHPRIAAWFGKQSQRPSVRMTAPLDDQ
ncbi:MAG: glutathione S-transferase [Pseudomonadota bacterium]